MAIWRLMKKRLKRSERDLTNPDTAAPAPAAVRTKESWRASRVEQFILHSQTEKRQSYIREVWPVFVDILSSTDTTQSTDNLPAQGRKQECSRIPHTLALLKRFLKTISFMPHTTIISKMLQHYEINFNMTVLMTMSKAKAKVIHSLRRGMPSMLRDVNEMFVLRAANERYITFSGSPLERYRIQRTQTDRQAGERMKNAKLEVTKAPSVIADHSRYIFSSILYSSNLQPYFKTVLNEMQQIKEKRIMSKILGPRDRI
ncbi:hypothetical protein CBL_11221 [Carabus blaptoides fortunei]